MARAIAIGLVFAAACADSSPQASLVNECTTDSDCGGDVCARTNECVAPDQLREARVEWTVAKHAPDASTCANATSADFLIELKANPEPTDETLMFGPVPCTRGVFAIDKVPMRFWIGGAKSREAGMWVPLDANGTAVVDLPF